MLQQCEELYCRVCLDPDEWSDAALADWIAAAAEVVSPDKEVARELRRVLRIAHKLREFWVAGASGRPEDHGDWRTRVDIAIGPKAWRPLLALARLGLARQPSRELFEEVKQRFRVVSAERWMEGVEYDEWIDLPAGGDRAQIERPGTIET